MTALTRREALRILLAASALRADETAPVHGCRPFRADATVKVLSIPLYARAGVGGAFAFHTPRTAGDSLTHLLGFCGGSFPDRACGLNRIGFIQETVVEDRNVISEAAYLGFVTASDERSMEQAREALHRQPDAAAPFVAIRGVTRPRESRATVARFQAEALGGWRDWRSVLGAAQNAFRHHPAPRVLPCPDTGGGAPATFLFALAGAMADTGLRVERPFVYSSHSYILRAEKAGDEQMGKRLAAKRLTAHPGRILRLTGRIRNQQTGDETKFRLWFESGERLPLRIEHQVRSYLVLSFEADPTLTAPIEAPVPL